MRGEQLRFFSSRESKGGKFCINISLDTLAIFLIIIIFVVIFSYVLGVEKGKKHIMASYHAQDEFAGDIKIDQIEKKQRDKVKETGKKPPSETKKQAPETPVIKKEDVAAADRFLRTDTKIPDTGGYIVQVASYTNKKIAKYEELRLREKGYPALLTQQGNYLVLSVGKYGTRDEAEEKAGQLKSRYGDCIIKEVEK